MTNLRRWLFAVPAVCALGGCGPETQPDASMEEPVARSRGALRNRFNPDYDGDGRADFAVWRPSTGIWSIRFASGATSSTQWGASTDVPVPGDYDGDGRTDLAVFRPSTNQWFHIRSSDGNRIGPFWGNSSLGDRPVPGDYDGDGRTDFAVWRPSTGNWSIRFASGATSSTLWGAPTDVPVPRDYYGDGRTDLAVFRPSTNQWFHIRSSDGNRIGPFWGNSSQGDRPASTFVP